VNPNLADYDQRTALHLACAEGHLHIVKYFLDSEPVAIGGTTALTHSRSFQTFDVKANINARDRWQGTALTDALRGGFQEVVQYMVSQGATE
jgi:ankyrin repeat protein